MKIPKATLNPKEKHILGNYIMLHCTIPNGGQYAKWDEESGGSDTAVVDKLKPQIPTLTYFHVRYMRGAFDLQLEPHRIMFIPPHKKYKITELDNLRDKVEALQARMITLENIINTHADINREHDVRLQALEDKYTNPKVVGPDEIDYRMTESAAGRAVATVIDPILPPIPTTMFRYRKGKHRR